MATVNFDLSSVFDKDVIINRNGTTTDSQQDGLSVGNETLVTQTFATFKAGANGNGLPDSGFFAANSYHPDIQLGYSNTNDGNNAKILSTNNTSFTFNVASDQYSAIHLLATSTNGTAGIEVKFNYSDGTNETKTGNVPDWSDTISETPNQYYLIDGMDRSYDVTGTNYHDANTLALYGLKFAPTSTKTLSSLTFTKNSGSTGNWVGFFGATGESISNSPPSITSANSANIPENIAKKGIVRTES